MANTKKKTDSVDAIVEQPDTVSTDNPSPVVEKHYAIPKREPSVWKTIELADINTYVMNIPTGAIIHTESSNGCSTCFIPNVRHEDGFKRIT